MDMDGPRIVGLPMYDPPELHDTVDAWWRGVAHALRLEGVEGVPDVLERGLSLDALWTSPRLLLTQTCGFPLLGAYAGHLQYLATPQYAAAGCVGSNYCSWIVVGADSTARDLEDLRGARCSINSRISHSGYNVLRALVAPLARDGAFFRSVSVSGGHAESLAQLGRGDVDVATIDCITYALLRRCRPRVVAATRILGRAASAPGLPFATRIGASPALVGRLQAGLARAMQDPALATVRSALLLTGLEVLPAGSYTAMAQLDVAAKHHGYHELD